jgi:hypothetical protein
MGKVPAILFAAAALACAGEPDDLVRVLGENDASRRNEACERLRAMGFEAQRALEAGARSGDPEVRATCERLLERLRLRKQARFLVSARSASGSAVRILGPEGQEPGTEPVDLGDGGTVLPAGGDRFLALPASGGSWLLDASGGKTAITRKAKLEDAAISPDGKQVYYFSPGFSNRRLKRRPLEPGGKAEQVLDLSAARLESYEVFPLPADRALVIGRLDGQAGVSDVFLAGGGGLKALTTGSKDSVVRVSPDGSRFAIASESGDDVLTVRLFESATLEPTASVRFKAGDYCAPGLMGWSPDSSRVFVFAEDALSLLEAKSGAVREIAEAAAPAGFGVWSPDAASVAWCCNREAARRIDYRAVRADGSGLVRVAEAGSMGDYVPDLLKISWSPDSGALAWLKAVEDPEAGMHPRIGTELWVSLPDGGEAFRVTDGPVDDFYWLPSK